MRDSMRAAGACGLSGRRLLVVAVALWVTPAGAQDERDLANWIRIESVLPRESDGAPIGLAFRDLARLTENLPSVSRAVPWREFPATIGGDDDQIDLRIIGTTGEWYRFNNIRITRGRFLSESDVQTRRPVVVLDEATALEVFESHDPVGRNIAIGESEFAVVGICEISPREEDDRLVLMPITTARIRFGDTVAFEDGSSTVLTYELSGIGLEIDQASHVAASKETARRLLTLAHPDGDFRIVEQRTDDR